MKTTRYILTLIVALLFTTLYTWGAITPSTPSKDASGVYQIGTAAELWGFANLVNSTSGTNIALNAKLTADIELPAEDFPMIGVYNTKKYAGTFDGDGHTISGLQISSIATGIGLFRTTYGATIKNFKLSGTITVTNGTSSSYFIASVVGFADNNTKIEDVSSSVNITFNGGSGGTGGVRIVGGIAGRVKGTLNRCRYNGTIDASNASAIGDRLAGICAEGNSALNITNCLFDGTIKTACTATGNNHRVGGVVAFSNGATVKVDNCLSTGSYEFAATASLDNCGIVAGFSNAATCTNTYYTTTTNLSRSGINNGGVTAVSTTPWATITDNLNGGAAVTDCNWKVVAGQLYPIPMSWTKTLYTITFDTQGGNDIDAVSKENNTVITLPTAEKTGYRFDGWNTAANGSGASYAAGSDYTITANATLYAQYSINQYTITFNTDGGSAVASITQDYNTSITKPADPTKTGYTFAGWSETIPSTMPAENKTITATWTINQYTISFNTDGGSAVASITQDYNTSITKPADPTKTGYAFAGWSEAIPSTMPAENKTITATWTINQYHVYYYVNNVLYHTDTYDYAAAVTPLTGPENDRYTFSGWSEIPSTMPANDVRVDGTFTYTANSSGVYEIGNREDYVNFVAVTKTNAAASAKLIADIDLNNEAVDCIGTSSASYTGTFDGQGYTINNYYRNTTSGSYSGLFAHVTNATIRNFKIKGNVTIAGTGQQHGSVIGVSTGTTHVEDVWSSVNVTITGATAQVGGFVGRAGGTYNRCRYNGTVTSSTAYDKIGGFASNLRDGHLNNCLFDGSLSLSANNENLCAGGLAAAVIEVASTMEGCLSHGTITIANKTYKCGIAIGFADKNITVNKLYYTTTNAGTLPGIGKVTATLTGSAKDATSMSWTDVNEGLNPSTGSEGHWHIVAEQAYPVPGQCEHTHEHRWGDDGYCPFDGARQPIEEVDGYYQIANKGQFLAFYEVTQTNPSANAKLTADIDLENIEFAGFGSYTTPYTGTFDGNKKTISGYKRTFTSGNSSLGFFNATSGATIKDFTLEGEEIYNINSACYAIGSVIGMSTNTTIEGVTSKVKMTFGANCPSGTGGIRVVGGLVGRISGGSINKCRYNGTIDLSANSGICDRFGGIVGDLGAPSTISNSLFDGEIKVAATSSLAMGGILGTNNSKAATISHCLFNGKMTFPAGAIVSNCGPISGGTGVTASDSYYDMTGFTVDGTTQAKTAVRQSSSIERTTQPWIDICVALNNGSTNWGIQSKEYPVPGDQAAQNYTITFDSNGGSAVEQMSLPAGAAIVAPENPTWEGHTFTGWSPALPATMPENNITVTAQWELTSYNVNYYVDNTFYQAVPVKYTATITPIDAPTKDRYTFSGWSGFPDGNLMPANDIRIDGTFTFSPNAETGVYEIANQEDLFNFAAYVNSGTGQGNGHGSANAKLLNDITLDGTTPFPGIGKYVTYKDAENKDVRDDSYAYTGTFDGDGHSITGYVRNASGNYGGMFNYTYNATIKDFSLAGTMTIAGNGQQFGSVVGCSAGTTLVEDVYSSVNVTISSTAAQVGGFVGRAGGTYNRCRYSGTIFGETAFNKIGGFAGNIQACTLANCLFDGKITLSTDNAALMTAGLVASSFGDNPHIIKNCLVNGTMNISHSTDSCGIVVGYYEQALTVDHTYYTGSGRPITGAKGTLTGRATPVGSLTMDQLLAALNPTSGIEGNWEIKTSTGSPTYPVPSNCTIEEHVHSYNDNGFCIAGDAYEPAAKAQDGYYQVTNAGNLWWLMEQINSTEEGTLPKTTRIRLMNDIDMEGEAHGSFPGICTLGKIGDQNDWEGTAYQGIFNGEGYTISNYYQQINAGLARRGLFNAVYNATIKDFNINGSLTISGNGVEAVMIGAAIGSAAGTSIIEDINSSVTITVNNGIVRDLGGVVGGLGDQTNKASTTMNRCRYNGTITLKGTQDKAAKNVGGVVGELRSAVMKNCLYDGTITVSTGVTYESIGGVVGKVGTNDNSEIHRTLSHGTITLPDGYDATANANKCGIVVGAAEKTIYLYKCFHTTNKGGGATGSSTSGLDYIGPHTVIKSVKNEDTGVTSDTEVDQLLGKSNDLSSDLDSLYKPGFRTILGESNWAAVEQTSGNYTYPKKDEEHIHKYSNGFCTSGDGEYEKPNAMGKIYQIMNGGQLYWFATHFNNKEIPQDATVEIMKDIDMEYDKYIFPGIGTSDYRFQGTFAGHERKIKRFYRDIISQECTGLINYAEGATIKDFTIYGQINYNLPTVKSFHGSVVGMATGKTTVISDVFSFVNLNATNANVRVLGGIAGRSSGTMRRCRYSGTIAHIRAAGDTTYTTSGRQIAGLIANAREEILIEDCLFDGTIWSTCQEADTMRVSGILASNEKNSGVTITIKNSLFNGCLKLQHTYQKGRDGTGVKSTENGIIAGYWDSNLPKVVNNLFYLKKCQEDMDSLSLGYFVGSKQDSTKVELSITEIEGTPSDSLWNEIFKELDEFKVDTITGDTIRNGNWEYKVDSTSVDPYPTPGGHTCQHLLEDGTSAYDEHGYCTICGIAKPLKKDDDGKYIMEAISDLAGFRDLINSGTSGADEFNAKLTQDIDFSTWDGDFGEPIGNSHFNRYLYNFDGQGYSLLNVNIKTDDEYVGFFGFAGDSTHDCIIHDLTITGTIDAPYDSKTNDDKPLYMGVVGKMYRGKIYNVHSKLVMKNENPTRAVVGGILGCCETPEGNDKDGNLIKVLIDKCSYTGDCYLNAVGNIGGIVGETSRNTEVKNCTFAGALHHTYKGGNNSTNFAGIVGYNNESTFQGVQNCIVAGVLNTDPDRVFVGYDQEGNHRNVLTGFDTKIPANNSSGYWYRYANNYSINDYLKKVPEFANADVHPLFLPVERFINGEVCAQLNALDDASGDIQNGHPWGQVLGYQKGGISAAGNFVPGNHTDGSPAQRVPIPGWFADSVKQADDSYEVVKRCYKVVATENAATYTDEEGNTKHKQDYTADWYYFDDQGDATPYPTDAASMKVKKIEYHRAAEHLTGFNSFCLPFEFTQEIKNTIDPEAIIYTYAIVEGSHVNMTRVNEGSIPAGTPFVLYTNKDDEWQYIQQTETGSDVALQVTNPSETPATGTAGLYGSFDTKLIGSGFYKLTPVGDHLVKTIGEGDTEHGPLSHCYPYRAYFKLSDSSSAPERDYQLWFADEDNNSPDEFEQSDEIPVGPRYNVLGMQVDEHATGIIIVDGKKYFVTH